MRIVGATALIVAILVVSGIVQGNFTGRWIPADTDLSVELARVNGIPETIGDWRMSNQVEPKENVLKILLCKAYLQREYTNVETGDEVSVVWIAGPSGPTVAHIPEICYTSQNYEAKGERVRFDLKRGGSLWRNEFHSKGLAGDEFVVLYGWSRGEDWQASSYPRIEFGGASLVYKVQVSAQVSENNTDPAANFVNQFLEHCWNTSNSSAQ